MGKSRVGDGDRDRPAGRPKQGEKRGGAAKQPPFVTRADSHRNRYLEDRFRAGRFNPYKVHFPSHAYDVRDLLQILEQQVSWAAPRQNAASRYGCRVNAPR